MAAVQRLRDRYGAELSPMEAYRAFRGDPQGGTLDLGINLWALEPDDDRRQAILDELTAEAQEIGLYD